jgi:YD repeat-containing protein
VSIKKYGIGRTFIRNSAGKVSQISHSNGRSLTLVWNGNHISSMTDPDFHQIAYDYGVHFNVQFLDSVSFPNGDSTTYYYEQGPKLTGYALNGTRIATITYENADYGQGRVKKTVLAGNVESTSFADASGGGVIVTNASGATANYQRTFSPSGGSVVSSTSQSGVVGCPNGSKSVTYDTSGFVSTETQWSVTVGQYAFEDFGHLTSKYSGSDNRKDTFSWDTTNNLLISVQHSDTVTPQDGAYSNSYTYFPVGSSAAGRLQRASTKNLSTQYGVLNQERSLVYSYTFNSNGTLASKTVTGPISGQTTTYNYDAVGDLASYTNALNQTTTYEDYNGRGQPGKITDPNGAISHIPMTSVDM